MIKTWLITASAPFCGTEQYYCAFSELDPLDSSDFPYDELADDLWNAYSYLLHLEDDEYESEEDYEEAYDQAYEDWIQDCNFESEEMSLEELQDYIPGGPKSETDLLEIIYDERK
jgi:hypothetical protein